MVQRENEKAMKQKKSGEYFSEWVVGVFMVAVLGLLAYFTIIISGIDLLRGTTKIPIQATFTDVGGLKIRDPVIVRGMTVGTVDDMSLSQGRVDVTLMVRKDVKLKEDYRLSIYSSSLLGGNYLLLEEGEGAELAPGTVLKGEAPREWMRDLSQMVTDIREATGDGRLKSIVSNLDAVALSFKTVVARVEEGKGLLGKLFSEDLSLYNDLSNAVANLRSVTMKIDTGTNSLGRLLNDDGRTYANVKDLVANLKSVSGRLERGEGTLGKLLSSDESIYRDLREMTERLNMVAGQLEKGEGSLGKLLKDDSKIYDDLAATVANLRTVTDRLEKGEGTLGKLSADSALYEDIHGLIKDVRQTVDNFRDTTPITAFSSLLMGGL